MNWHRIFEWYLWALFSLCMLFLTGVWLAVLVHAVAKPNFYALGFCVLLSPICVGWWWLTIDMAIGLRRFR